MKIILTKELDEDFASQQELDEMSDEDIIDLIIEDVIGTLVDGGSWKIIR